MATPCLTMSYTGSLRCASHDGVVSAHGQVALSGVARPSLGRALIIDAQHLIGLAGSTHPWCALGHTRSSQAVDCRFLLEQLVHVDGGDMPLHHIAVHYPGMAGSQLGGDTVLLFDGLELLGFDDLDLKAVTLQMFDPGFAAATILGFVNGHLLCGQGRKADNTGHQGQQQGFIHD